MQIGERKKVGILTSTIGTDRVLNGLISTFIIYVCSATSKEVGLGKLNYFLGKFSKRIVTCKYVELLVYFINKCRVHFIECVRDILGDELKT
jgi:hypothetical protein